MAVDRISDQEILLHVVLYADFEHGCCHALEKLKDLSMLTTAAQICPRFYVRERAVKRLEDSGTLAEIVLNDPDVSVRCAAAERITDQKALCCLLEDDRIRQQYFNRERLALVRNLDSSFQTLLAGLALEDPYEDIRRNAVERLEDTDTLEKLTHSEHTLAIRLAAIRRLDNQAVLAKAALTDAAAVVRGAAIGRLSDQEVLTEIAQTDSEELIRMAAVRRLTYLNEEYDL